MAHPSSKYYYSEAIMTQQNKKEKTLPAIEAKLARLEEIALERGIQVHYDRLEAAGLKLKGGICTVRGERHLFIDRRKSIAEKIGLLEDYLGGPPVSVSMEDAFHRTRHPRTGR
ncbi:MAG: hypothetical protein DRG82_02330 [Deltaproteobacteria bacterium]|nr:MAG: hypothetical protein B1H13_02795 [Desulfobacteraceae bacterium 4484_190.3]RLB19045.1 MAG: hypothetical protein DRG82_02330 [Deltaproteobacteria bacterium]